MIDLTKLTPAAAGSVRWRHSQMSPTDWKFYELARNAFDVMMRRHWSPELQSNDTWGVYAEDQGAGGWCDITGSPKAFASWVESHTWPDPLTALVEADKWYRENVEQQEDSK